MVLRFSYSIPLSKKKLSKTTDMALNFQWFPIANGLNTDSTTVLTNIQNRFTQSRLCFCQSNLWGERKKFELNLLHEFRWSIVPKQFKQIYIRRFNKHMKLISPFFVGSAESAITILFDRVLFCFHSTNRYR